MTAAAGSFPQRVVMYDEPSKMVYAVDGGGQLNSSFQMWVTRVAQGLDFCAKPRHLSTCNLLFLDGHVKSYSTSHSMFYDDNYWHNGFN